MALIPHSLFPRSAFDMDQWFRPPHLGHHGPSTLDLFDPFDELDHTIADNLQWLNKPEFMQPVLFPRVPQKYRIVLDVVGYSPKSIQTEVKGNQLFVHGKEEVKHEDGDYSVKEFRKTYKLPDHAETDKLVSFVTAQGQMVIEVPLKETHLHKNVDLFPKIVDKPGGGKEVTLGFQVPENIHPEKVSVSVKDRDLIVKAEDKIEKPDGVSKFFYYKRTTLPENTDFTHMKCHWDNHRISINAPLNLDYKPNRKIPIEHKKH